MDSANIRTEEKGHPLGETTLLWWHHTYLDQRSWLDYPVDATTERCPAL